MLDNRNNNWVKNMPELMKKESVFFAVGAAHLGGEEGVINLLKKAGYSVKPILN
ncbi:TraB family protein [compost metagenome]